jgi:hypothetical protein
MTQCKEIVKLQNVLIEKHFRIMNKRVDKIEKDILQKEIRAQVRNAPEVINGCSMLARYSI